MITPSRQRISDDRMLDSACAVFAEEGFDRAHLEKVAADAGITRPTLYARFGSKDGLFRAVVEREASMMMERLFTAYNADPNEPFHKRLKRWIDAYFDFVRERPDGFRLITAGERHPAAAALVQRSHADIVDRIAGLVSSVAERPRGPGGELLGEMIASSIRDCARAALANGTDLDDAAALAHAFLYTTLRELDLELLDAVDRRAGMISGR